MSFLGAEATSHIRPQQKPSPRPRPRVPSQVHAVRPTRAHVSGRRAARRAR